MNTPNILTEDTSYSNVESEISVMEFSNMGISDGLSRIIASFCKINEASGDYFFYKYYFDKEFKEKFKEESKFIAIPNDYQLIANKCSSLDSVGEFEIYNKLAMGTGFGDIATPEVFSQKVKISTINNVEPNYQTTTTNNCASTIITTIKNNNNNNSNINNTTIPITTATNNNNNTTLVSSAPPETNFNINNNFTTSLVKRNSSFISKKVESQKKTRRGIPNKPKDNSPTNNNIITKNNNNNELFELEKHKQSMNELVETGQSYISPIAKSIITVINVLLLQAHNNNNNINYLYNENNNNISRIDFNKSFEIINKNNRCFLLFIEYPAKNNIDQQYIKNKEIKFQQLCNDIKDEINNTLESNLRGERQYAVSLKQIEIHLARERKNFLKKMKERSISIFDKHNNITDNNFNFVPFRDIELISKSWGFPQITIQENSNIFCKCVTQLLNKYLNTKKQNDHVVEYIVFPPGFNFVTVSGKSSQPYQQQQSQLQTQSQNNNHQLNNQNVTSEYLLL